MKERIKKDLERFQKENKRISELAKRDLKKYKKDIYGEANEQRDSKE